MFYYKNSIDGKLLGLTESSYKLNIENFFEIEKEEYIQFGGSIGNDENAQSDSENLLVSALIN